MSHDASLPMSWLLSLARRIGSLRFRVRTAPAHGCISGGSAKVPSGFAPAPHALVRGRPAPEPGRRTRRRPVHLIRRGLQRSADSPLAAGYRGSGANWPFEWWLADGVGQATLLPARLDRAEPPGQDGRSSLGLNQVQTTRQRCPAATRQPSARFAPRRPRARSCPTRSTARRRAAPTMNLCCSQRRV